MNRTKIEQCDMTWNPVTGCLHGCEYCYARKIAYRFGSSDSDGGNHDLKDACYYLDRKSIDRILPYPYGFDPTFHHYKLDEPQKIKKPKTIFVCSMADLFGEWVPDEWIFDVFAACQNAPQHRYLFLTKNPVRYARLAVAGKLPETDNMWYGSTLDSMKATRYPGRHCDHTFLSIEPLTERMSVRSEILGSAEWIIIGAETGNRKGKVIPKKEWVDTICAEADLTHTAVFMKDSLIPIVGEKNMRREFPW